MRPDRREHAGVTGVLFDLDDTLIDWWGSLQACLGEVVDQPTADTLFEYCRATYWERHPEHGHVWHRNTWALHHHRDVAWPAALPHIDPAELTLLMERFDQALWVGFYEDTTPTLDLLRERFDATLRLGILSNNGLLPGEVDRLGLRTWFDVAVSADRDARKPDPAAFALGCRALGTDPERTVYVGDSVKADALGALGAGLIPVWVDRWDDPWPGRPAGVHRIATLADLPALIDTLL